MGHFIRSGLQNMGVSTEFIRGTSDTIDLTCIDCGLIFTYINLYFDPVDETYSTAQVSTTTGNVSSLHHFLFSLVVSCVYSRGRRA